MNEKFLRTQYEQLCKELGHFEYHRLTIEKKIETILEQIKAIDALTPLAALNDKAEQK